ncbi:MAG TPA: hypothetical protein VFW64_12305 [Pseudonocardiaceae bacterium]|nr:hypothetical protein [Pseudonocardiaceae bacterium]
MNLKLSKQQVVHAVAVAAGVFAAAFAASLAASGFGASHFTDLAVYQKAVEAGYAAVVGLLAAAVNSWLGALAKARQIMRRLSRGRANGDAR